MRQTKIIASMFCPRERAPSIPFLEDGNGVRFPLGQNGTDRKRQHFIDLYCKQRGVVHASITRLGTRLKELEESSGLPQTPDHTRQLLAKLQSLDDDFKKSDHLELIDLIDKDDELETASCLPASCLTYSQD